MSRYLATINVPGYLPMDDEPPVFDTPADAWEYLADERRRDEDDATDEDGPYSDTVTELDKRVAHARSGLVCDFECVGSVTGDTPGGRMYDLGVVYTVTELGEGE